MNRTVIVYGLRKGGEVVYVGRTVNLARRIKAHRVRGVDFDEVIMLEEVDQADCVAAETEAILKYNPPLNLRTNGNGYLGIVVGASGIELRERINISLQRQLHRAAVHHCRKLGMTFSALLSQLLRIELAKTETDLASKIKGIT